MEYGIFELVKAPAKPGPGWVNITDEFAEKIIKFEEENLKILEKWDEIIEQSIFRVKAEE